MNNNPRTVENRSAEPTSTLKKKKVDQPKWLKWPALALLLIHAIVRVEAQSIVSTGSVTNGLWHTATMLTNGLVLSAGGGSNEPENPYVIDSARLYNTSTGTWSDTGNMTYGRKEHTATLLNNGDVLVAGGTSSNSILNSAEIYNTTSGVWTVTGSLGTTRYNHTATRLTNGNVLVTGGNVVISDENTPSTTVFLSTTEIFTNGTWYSAAAMNDGRAFHQATLLPNGNVLVTGGIDNNGQLLATAEIYTNGVWIRTGSMTDARASHTATLLTNGMVLVTGGGYDIATCELYNPATGTWTSVQDVPYGRSEHSATLLPDGRVLVAGGRNLSSSQRAAIFDPLIGRWKVMPETHVGRGFTATLLTNGRVLFADGNCELFDPRGLSGWMLTNGTFLVTNQSPVSYTLYASTNLDDASNLGTLAAHTSYVDTNSAGISNRFYFYTDGEFATRAVGFVRVTVPATDYVMIADQLINSTNNTITNLLMAAPSGTVIQKFNENTQQFTRSTNVNGVWSNPNLTLNPGEGLGFYNNTNQPITITFTGIVPEFGLTNPIPQGLSIRSSMLPIAGRVSTDLLYPVGNGDFIQQRSVAPSTGLHFDLFNDYVGGWEGDSEGAEPVVSVGEAFWINNGSSAKNWILEFDLP
jgi:hypothetical protein